MEINIGQWSFRPRLVTSLLALVFMALFVRLGLWQLQRAEYKADRYQSFVERQQQTPLNLAGWSGAHAVEDMLWRRVEANGRFEENKQVLLDNRVIKGQTGYFVYTPFVLATSGQYILVNRGWVAAPQTRDELPVLKTTSQPVKLSGQLKAVPRTGIMLADVAPEQPQQGVFRVQKIDLQKQAELLGVSLLPFILQLEQTSAYGYGTEWSLPGSDEQMHRGYAYQWFAFAATLLVIYLVLNIKKRKLDE